MCPATAPSRRRSLLRHVLPNIAALISAPHLALWPGLCLTVVVYSLNMFGDAVRDLLDPRLRGRLGRYGAARSSGGIHHHR